MTKSTQPTSSGSYAADLAAIIAPERLARSQASTRALQASGIEGNALAAGMIAPDFTLPDVRGEMVSLSDLRRSGPVVVTFYRGTWCPYCNLALRAYQHMLPDLQALGAQLVAVSPQIPDESLSMAEKNALEFPVVSDLDNTVARQYGLVFTLDAETRERYLGMGNNLVHYNGNDAWELPMPGTFVVGQDGIITLAFAKADYTQRLEPAEILAALASQRTT
ncbi:MAG: AhpC/TSA family protein [Roseiflexaceae bacterium]|nr:AhpC/TSA family protein [Roseiflexaceae bacterium]